MVNPENIALGLVQIHIYSIYIYSQRPATALPNYHIKRIILLEGGKLSYLRVIKGTLQENSFFRLNTPHKQN